MIHYNCNLYFTIAYLTYIHITLTPYEKIKINSGLNDERREKEYKSVNFAETYVSQMYHSPLYTS